MRSRAQRPESPVPGGIRWAPSRAGRLGEDLDPRPWRDRDEQARPRVATGNQPAANRLKISAFGELAKTMVIRCLGRLRFPGALRVTTRDEKDWIWSSDRRGGFRKGR